MSESRTANAKRNIIIGTINKVIQLGLPFVIRTVIIWKLGAEYLGLGSLFTSILQVLNMAELGFSSAIIFSLYKPLAENDTEKICALMALYRRIYNIIGCCILLAGLVLLPFLPRLIKGDYPAGINIYILYSLYLVNTVISYLAFAYKSVLLTASQRQDVISSIEFVLALCRGAFQILVLFIFKDFYLYVIGNVLYTVCYNLCINRKTKKMFPMYICKGTISKDEKRQITKQIGGLAIGKLCLTTRNSFDSIILSLFCGLVDVAIFSNYFYVITAVQGLSGIILMSISAGIGNSVATDSKEKNYRDLKKFNFYFAWISSWCAICMLCLFQPFMILWVGKDLTAPFLIAVLFCLYFYVGQMGQIRALYSNAYGVWWEFRYFSIFEAITNLIFDFVLGYFFGMKGIVLVTVVTMFLFSIVGISIKTFKLCFDRSAKDYFIWIAVYFTVTLFAASLTRFLCDLFPIQNILGLICRLVVCMIIPNMIFAIISLCSKEYRGFLQFFVKNYLRIKN